MDKCPPPSIFLHQHFLLLVFWWGREIRILKWVSSAFPWWLRMPNTLCFLTICIPFLEDCLSNFIICLSSSMCVFVYSRHRSCQMLKGFSHSASCSSLAWQFPLWYRSFFSFTRSRLSVALFSALLGSASESSYLCLSGDVYSLLVFLEVSNFQVWCWCPWCICSWVLRGRMLNLCLHFLHLHIQGFQHHLLNVSSFLQFLLLLASLSKIRGLYLSEVVSGSPLLTWYRGHAVFSMVALESTLISGLNTDFTILFAQDHSSYSWSFVSPHKFWDPHPRVCEKDCGIQSGMTLNLLKTAFWKDGHFHNVHSPKAWAWKAFLSSSVFLGFFIHS